MNKTPLRSLRVAVGHYAPHSIIASSATAAYFLVLLALEGRADEPFGLPPWWTWLLIPVPFGVVYVWGSSGHAISLCTRCARVPRNPQKTAQRWHNMLWLHHQLTPKADRSLAFSVTYMVLILGSVVGNFWWSPWPLMVNIFLSISWALSQVVHPRVAAWCPWCQHNDTHRTDDAPSKTAVFQMLRTQMLHFDAVGGPVRYGIICRTFPCEVTSESFDNADTASRWLAGHLDTEHRHNMTIRIGVTPLP